MELRPRLFPLNWEDEIDFSKLDIVLLGGGSDREQMLVCEKLKEIQKDFKAYVENYGVVIAICGGYQLLGNYYKTEQGTMKGLESGRSVHRAGRRTSD